MSDWTPEVGDWVMVGENGPYEVRAVHNRMKTVHLLLHYDSDPELVNVGTAMWAWLTPAPEPEPEEPTAPGALVRNSEGILLFRTTGDASRWHEVMNPGGGYWEWDEIARPVTVILADPADVETLRADLAETKRLLDVARGNAEARLQSAMHATERAVELQQRINKVVARGPGWIMQHGTAVMCILQGES